MFKLILKKLWPLSLFVLIFGGYILWEAFNQYNTFSLRYGTNVTIDKLINYQFKNTVQSIKKSLMFNSNLSSLPIINISIPKDQIKLLEKQMPQTGFEYVKASINTDEWQGNVKIKYRGDFEHHWMFNKRSYKVKTKKNNLYNKTRVFNLISPKLTGNGGLGNGLGYELASHLDLITPQSYFVRVNLNGIDQGVYLFVEQIEESTLRSKNLMPGDIYRGEVLGKDAYMGTVNCCNLFASSGIWDKVSINNHYPDDSMEPLKELITIINQENSIQKNAKLSQILDLKEWSKFSIFESLAATFHYDKNHNWRLYYDPWKQKFLPIVWDPIAWSKVMRQPIYNGSIFYPRIHTDIMQQLFYHEEFNFLRHEALKKFFDSGRFEMFLASKNKVVDTLINEFKSDKEINSRSQFDIVSHELISTNNFIDKLFLEAKQSLQAEDNLDFFITSGNIYLNLHGNFPIRFIKFEFAEPNDHKPNISISYKVKSKSEKVKIVKVPVKEESFSSTSYTANVLLSPEIKFNDNQYDLYYSSKLPKYDPVTYEINHNFRIDNVVGIYVDRGYGLEKINKADNSFNEYLASNDLNKINDSLSEIEVWSGVKVIDGVHNVKNPVIIKPGTLIKLKPNASIIFRNRLIAEGEKNNPIIFEGYVKNQKPWGTVALVGPKSDNSEFNFLIFDGGSGYKKDLFEYSGMISIHDANNILFKNSIIKNGSIVDDMVHIVYSKNTRFENVFFYNSFSDAFDIDISEVSLKKCHFFDSGNDALDIMQSKVSVIDSAFNNSQDKGISVGEGSLLFSVNNLFESNEIAIQSKDSSEALIFNSYFKDNKKAIHSYKKNWRYGDGGNAYIFKSIFEKNTSTLEAEKKSKIYIFDSYVDIDLKNKIKHVFPLSIDNSSFSVKNSKLLIPENLQDKNLGHLESLIENFNGLKAYPKATKRGMLND